MELRLRLPDDIALGLKIPADRLEIEILKEVSFALYAGGKASLGVARRISGLGKREFLEELGKRKIPRHYSEKDLDSDLDYAQSSQ